MGTLRRLKISANELQDNSIYPRHLNETLDSEFFDDSIFPCSDLSLIWDNSDGKWKRISIKDLVLFGVTTPIISVNVNSINFGTYDSSDVITREFIITNLGNDNLIISNISSPIGFSAYSFDVVFPLVINSSDSKKIHITFSASNSVSGQFPSILNITNNDPNSSLVTLNLNGETEDIVVPPTSSIDVDFGVLRYSWHPAVPPNAEDFDTITGITSPFISPTVGKFNNTYSPYLFFAGDISPPAPFAPWQESVLIDIKELEDNNPLETSFDISMLGKWWISPPSNSMVTIEFMTYLGGVMILDSSKNFSDYINVGGTLQNTIQTTKNVLTFGPDQVVYENLGILQYNSITKTANFV